MFPEILGIPAESQYDTQETGVLSLGSLVSLVKQFKNRHKYKLKEKNRLK